MGSVRRSFSGWGMQELLGALPFLFILFAFFIIPALTRQQRGALLEREFSRVQRKRKSRIIAIVHRQEPMGLLGIPILRYIDLNDAEDVLEAIRTTPPKQPLEIILHTPGGLVLPALQIARAVKAHPGPKRVFVPHYAMSGGTLIALAADEIILNKHAVLGPIDPQIDGFPAASLMRVRDQKSPDATQDYTLILADIGKMAIDQLEKAARELLRGTVSDNAAAAAAEQLSSGRWTHDYPIEAAEARSIGLNASTEMPAEIMELMKLFPDRLSRTSVKYINQTARAQRLTPGQAAPSGETDTAGRVPLTGFQPHAGSRSFSFGPWSADKLDGRSASATFADDRVPRTGLFSRKSQADRD